MRKIERRDLVLILVFATLVVLISGGAYERLKSSRQVARNEANQDKNAAEMGEFPVHKDIPATVFWVGEQAGQDNGYINNLESTWARDWVKEFGGVDTPDQRNGFDPAGFTPLENPFYFALPFSDYDRNGLKSNLNSIPWYSGQSKQGESILKNRWIAVSANGKTAYAQWEDVGPFEDDDADYVFGDERPKYEIAGIDLSPATATYLGIKGRGKVDWRFVSDEDVPDGPWKKLVTTSSPKW